MLYTYGSAPFNVGISVANGNNGRGKTEKKYRSRRRRFRNRQCVAALHAFLAARAYTSGWFGTLAIAAVSAGSNIEYVRAAITLVKSGQEWLITDVLRGKYSILAAAKMVEPQVKLIEAYQKASPANLEAFRVATGATADLAKHIMRASAEEKIAAARTVGVDLIWDAMVAPVVSGIAAE